MEDQARDSIDPLPEFSLEDLSRQTLVIKQENIDRAPWIVTPSLDDYDCSAIKEARGYGVSHAVFFDTSDKVVVFPSHVPGCERLYDATFFAWTDGAGWKKKATHKDREFASCIIKALGILLKARSRKVCLVTANGSCKGYLSGVDQYDDPADWTCDLYEQQYALWIYTTDDRLTDLLDAP